MTEKEEADLRDDVFSLTERVEAQGVKHLMHFAMDKALSKRVKTLEGKVNDIITIMAPEIRPKVVIDPAPPEGHWECTECGKDWGEGWDIGTHWMSKGKTFWCPPSDDYVPGCGKKAVKWIPAVEDATEPVILSRYAPPPEGDIVEDATADLSGNVFWCEACQRNIPHEEVRDDGDAYRHLENDSVHVVDIVEDFTVDEDSFDGIGNYVEGGRVFCLNCHQPIDGSTAPIPEAPESETSLEWYKEFSSGVVASWKKDATAKEAEIDRLTTEKIIDDGTMDRMDVEITRLTAENAELTEAIKKEVDDRNEVYDENEQLKVDSEDNYQQGIKRGKLEVEQTIKRYKEMERRVRDNIVLKGSPVMRQYILDALSEKESTPRPV